MPNIDFFHSMSVKKWRTPWPNTVAYYKMNWDATDSSGNGRNGTASNVSWVSGKMWNAGSFNGTSSSIAIGNLTSAFSTEATIVMWVKLNNATPSTDTKTGIMKLSSNVDTFHYPYTDGKIYCNTFRSARVDSITPSWTVTRSDWHMLTISTKPWANGWNLYQNDSLISTTTGESSISLTTTSEIWHNTVSYSPYNFYIDWLIDEVIIENKYRDSTAVSDYYNTSK